MGMSDARVNSFAEGCVGLGSKLGVDVVDLYSLFHKQPVRHNKRHLRGHVVTGI